MVKRCQKLKNGLQKLWLQHKRTIKTKQKYSVSRKSICLQLEEWGNDQEQKSVIYKGSAEKNSKNIHKQQQQQQKQISSPTMLIREGRDRGGKDEKMYKEIYHFFPQHFILNFKID